MNLLTERIDYATEACWAAFQSLKGALEFQSNAFVIATEGQYSPSKCMLWSDCCVC